MSQTTIIISHLEKADFVATEKNALPLAGQIKNALIDLFSGANEPQNVISHWSELPFLNRVIAIFEHEADAEKAFQFLQKSKSKELPGLELPNSAKISLQENLLQRSKSTESLSENHTKALEKSKASGASSGTGDLAGYHEPEPKHLDMYADLLKSGIDISKFNSKDQVDEVKNSESRAIDDGSDSALPPNLGRAKSVTKTLFKPSLSINTSTRLSGDGAPPLSPTITLDQI